MANYNQHGNTKHGLRWTPEYSCWLNMKQRCYNRKNTAYKNYGARGIVVCDEWKNDFQVFYNWLHKNKYEHGLTIDRIDNNGNYNPSNCRLVTRNYQAANKRNNNIVVGVSFNSTHKLWQARLEIKNKCVLNKWFKNFEDAVSARKNAEKEYGIIY